MNFTIFLNSRGRVNQLARCLEAVKTNTKDKPNLEVLVRADNDDEETLSYLSSNASNFGFKFELLTGSRPTSLCASFNEMANKAKGTYLFVLTDDAEISTMNWDEIALNRISNFKIKNKIKDNIIYGRTEDTSVDRDKSKGYASFPIISKQAVNTLGFFMYDSFVGLGGDSSIYRVYEEVGRVIDLSEIVLDHVYNNTIFKVMTPDLTGHEMRQRTAAAPINPFTFDVSKEVEKLKQYINNYGK